MAICPHQMAALCKATNLRCQENLGALWGVGEKGPGGGPQPWAGFMGIRVTGT